MVYLLQGSKLKMKKAGAKSGDLPELILHGGVNLWDRMLEVMQKVWEEGKVVRDWQEQWLFQSQRKVT